MSRRGRWGFALFIAFLAILVTALFTSPLVFLWRTHLAGFYGSDAFSHAWSTWWFDKALFTLHRSPARMDRIYYPVTFYHPILTATPYARLLALPGVHWGSPVAAYNVHLFGSYVLTWVLMALLCLELTGSRAAGVVGGAIFTFCANRTMHALNGHFTQVLTYSYPLLALCLWRVLKHPSIRRGVALGGALILVSVVDVMPLAYFVAPVTMCELLLFVLTDRTRMLSRVMLKSLGVGFGLAAVVLFPLMWPLLSSAARGDLGFYQEQGVLEYSADAWALVVPPPGHPLCHIWPGLQRLSAKILSFGLSYTEGVVYAGWATLVLAAIGTVWGWRRRRDVRLWAILAIGASVLALGPFLRAGGRWVTVRGQIVTLPYFLVRMLPFLSWGRTPARLNLTAMFALAILSAHGVSWLVGRARQWVWQQVVAAGLTVLVLLDAIVLFPWPVADTGVPAFYRHLAADRQSVAVLDLPVGDYTADKYYLLYQMTHGHAIVGGYSYRRPPEAEEAMLDLQALARPGGDPAALAGYGIGYIILHRDFLEGDELEMIILHLANCLGPPLYQDDRLVVFAVPDALEIAPTPLE